MNILDIFPSFIFLLHFLQGDLRNNQYFESHRNSQEVTADYCNRTSDVFFFLMFVLFIKTQQTNIRFTDEI